VISREEILELHGDDTLFADGFDDAIIGVAVGFDSGRVIYSVKKMIEILFKDAGMPVDEAYEYLEYNTFGAYVGKLTPIYMETI
tara:strand:+ start:1153 stop:1404 length:252 start_codon:yes stop_codon:yes gene_type:complete